MGQTEDGHEEYKITFKKETQNGEEELKVII